MMTNNYNHIHINNRNNNNNRSNNNRNNNNRSNGDHPRAQKYQIQNQHQPQKANYDYNILTELKDYYKPQWNLEKGALELLNFFKERNFDQSQFRGIYTNRLSCLSNLIFNKKINHQLRFI